MIQAERKERSHFAAMLMVSGSIAMSCHPALAQSITFDGTLGPAKPLTGPNYIIPQSDGLTVGRNLFHSFGQFKLDAGEFVKFESSNTIQNIITRVTGGNSSVINGNISTSNQPTGVNLFLINPNGIVFGDKAQLSIGNSTRGSFVATTADALTFPQGEPFSARNPGNANSLLRIVGDPSGFIASQQTPASIQVNGSRLRVGSGQSLVLLGGDVNLERGRLNAPGGRIEIGTTGAGSQVSLNTTNNILALGFPSNVERAGQIRANNTALIVTSPNGGNAGVSINSGSIEVKNRSNIVSSSSRDGSAGDVQLRAARSIDLLDSSLTATTEGTGTGGNIEIDSGGNIAVVNSSGVAQTTGQGNAGNILIRANGDVSMSKGSISTSSGVPRDFQPEDGFGNAGNISIQAKNIALANDTRLSATTIRDGRGGNIDLNAINGSLNVTNSEVRSRTSDRGDAGTISIAATDSVTVKGILASAPLGGVFTTTEGSGKAGDITIKAPSVRVLDRAVLDAQTTATGAAGKIQIQANELEVKDGGQIRTTTRSDQNAGEISATVRDRSILSGTNAGLFAAATSTGTAGNIDLSTRELSVLDGAKISVNSSNPTKNRSAGASNDSQSITVDTQSTTLDRGSIIAETASGNGGNITLSVDNVLLLRRNSLISTTAGTAQAGGNGGRITITSAPLIIAIPSENSDIRANAFNGKGGNVTISTRGLFGIQYPPNVLNPDRSAITASSKFGVDGTVTITTPEVDPRQGLVALPENLVDASNQIAQGCAPKGGQASSFVATGRGGLPISPNEPLLNRSTPSEWVSIEPNSKVQRIVAVSPPEQIVTAPETKIVEAQGWIKNGKGQVILVADPPESSIVANPLQTACLTH